MPLVASALETSLEALSDSPGATIADCAQLWANAVQAYAAPVFPPSLTVAAAGTALAGQLTAAFAQPSAIPTMETAFTAFALSVGGGMAPTFIAVPPPAPVGFAQLFAEPYPETHAAAAQKVSAAIDVWMRTGTATPAIGGPPVPWS